MALGTFIEENIQIKPRTNIKKCTKTISQPSKKSARGGNLEGEWLSMKNAEPTRPEGTQPISDSGPEYKVNCWPERAGVVATSNTKKSQPLEISQFDDVPIHLMFGICLS